jgi:aryl-alcohol dehydrogenase-like predicted oxidoreductase
MSKADMPIKFSPWADLWQTWHRWLADHDCSAVEACLAFPLSFPEIDRVVVGTDSVSQLAQIVSAVKQVKINLPNLQSEDENLINPGNWNLL